MPNWFFWRTHRPSEKNPTLKVTRALGSWEVEVGNVTQTGMHTASMWANAFTHLPQRPVASALLLGLGGAACVKSFHAHFPEATLTAIEFDPEMVRVAKEIGLYKPAPFPKVILGDVREVVPELPEKYDLIMLDVYEGNRASPAFEDDAFLSALEKHLTPQGVLLVNFSGFRNNIKKIASRFEDGSIWTFRANTLGAFYQ